MVLHIWDEFHFLKTRDSGTISDMGCVYRAMTSACMYPLTSRLTRPHPSPRAGNIFRGNFRSITGKFLSPNECVHLDPGQVTFSEDVSAI